MENTFQMKELIFLVSDTLVNVSSKGGQHCKAQGGVIMVCVCVCVQGDKSCNLIPYEVDMIIKASTETSGWHLV